MWRRGKRAHPDRVHNVKGQTPPERASGFSDFQWLGTYYQYANRLACLYCLNVLRKVPARLVLVYFMGDKFPDARQCPSSEAEWRELIRACHLTLGLSEKHALRNRVHELFIPVAAE
jgi:hypothetical protein